MEYTKPDFNNNIINISATLAEYLGVKTDKPKLPVLQKALSEHDYKNVVFMCFDGMGMYPIEANLLPSGFIRKNIVQTLTSTLHKMTRRNPYRYVKTRYVRQCIVSGTHFKSKIIINKDGKLL